MTANTYVSVYCGQATSEWEMSTVLGAVPSIRYTAGFVIIINVPPASPEHPGLFSRTETKKDNHTAAQGCLPLRAARFETLYFVLGDTCVPFAS